MWEAGQHHVRLVCHQSSLWTATTQPLPLPGCLGAPRPCRGTESCCLVRLATLLTQPQRRDGFGSNSRIDRAVALDYRGSGCDLLCVWLWQIRGTKTQEAAGSSQ